jgi:hypothetical protein
MITTKDKIGFIQRRRYSDKPDEFKLIVAKVQKVTMGKRKNSVYTKEFYPLEMEEIEANTEWMDTAKGLIVVSEPFLIKDEEIPYFQAVVDDFNKNGAKSVFD